MLKTFLSNIDNNRLIGKNDRVLLAVSGGIDSMVMADLFNRAGIRAGIAHCNFLLRGKESVKDEEFVKDYAESNNLPFYSIRFKTKEYAEKKKISIQMSARELRYEWFEKIRHKEGFDSVAVAHNLNDNIETLLLNLTRGTGIAGLTGIKPVNGNIIRPLLFASRKMIVEYCRNRHLKYREDKSNSEIKYTRNKIRHLVVPLLKEINPAVENSLNDTAERLGDAYEIVKEFIEALRTNLFVNREGILHVKIADFNQYKRNKTTIFELFRTFGINDNNLDELFKIFKGRTGGQLLTETHRIIKNRQEIIISGKSGPQAISYMIASVDEIKKAPFISSVGIITVTKEYQASPDRRTACLDLRKISFPLLLRNWRPGDFFYPFGMKQRKKLSDYFIDRKYSRLEKEKTLVIESGGKIIWVVGEMIDNRFRITDSTGIALVLKAT